MKNIVKSYVRIHMYEFISEFMLANSWWWNHLWFNHIWIHNMNSYVNSVLWRILWNHGWIRGNEFTYEIIFEFINLKSFWIQIQLQISVKENALLIQGNYHPFFAVSSLQALRLLHGCCSVVTRRCCCDGRRRVLHTAEQGRREGRCKDVTGVKICWAPACQQERKL